ncbi:mgtA regulatory leader peptide MgtL [Pseudenterobacter timonensis]|uniref:mgtA leader peptide n=1 Tax=Pseudenterobacter timonensis TaxID=1755099 RepID=A0ABV4A706_9ENTR
MDPDPAPLPRRRTFSFR